MDSLNTAHVPAPDPANFWDFAPGQSRTISGHPVVLLKCLFLDGRTRAKFEMTVEGDELVDWLNMNRPCVALKMPDDSPAVTFTLREIRDGRAFLQITKNPRLGEMRRQ